jgi:hypothetical protein
VIPHENSAASGTQKVLQTGVFCRRLRRWTGHRSSVHPAQIPRGRATVRRFARAARAKALRIRPNVAYGEGTLSLGQLGALGVARVSFGPSLQRHLYDKVGAALLSAVASDHNPFAR